ncbi:MAG TPA: ABC transporter substrate-binding protein [Methylomirabilota bacterium]|nr:ABC transporter substrate-binding protein [Methylomirabilota bacterium]
MRRTVQGMAVLVLLAFLPWLGPGAAESADKLLLGMPVKPPNMVHVPVFYALDKGLFKKHGLDVEVKFFRGGGATHRAATSAQSDLDVAWVPAPIAMSGISGGSGLKIFHSMAFKNEAQVAAKPGITSPAGLKGLTIGIEDKGGYSHLGALAVMGTAGLTDEDVKYIKTPPPARVPYLIGGKADAVVIHVEQVLLAQKQQPGVTSLGDIWKLMPDYLYGAFVAPEAKLESRRDAYVRFTAAMMESNRAVYKDKAGYLEVAKKWIGPVYAEHPDIVDRTYETFVKERIWSVNGGLPKSSVEWTNTFNAKLKKYRGVPPTYEQLVDLRIGKEALAKVGEVEPAEQ